MSPKRHNAYNSRLYRRLRPIVLAEAGHRCEWPGCLAVATTVDHIVPVVKGGSNDRANLRASCLPHNSQGGAALTNEARAARQLGPQSRQW
jgi:5-methylcytosine-specific restriction endonuclease McrA